MNGIYEVSESDLLFSLSVEKGVEQWPHTGKVFVQKKLCCKETEKKMTLDYSLGKLRRAC